MTRSHGPIAVFVPSVRGGGAERAMLVFSRELVKLGFAVDLVVANLDGALREVIPEGVSVVDLKSSKTFLALPRLVRYIKGRKPVAIYATIMNANVVAATAAQLVNHKIPVIVRESNTPITSPKHTVSSWLMYKCAPLAYRLTDGVIAVSQGVAEELQAMLPGMGDRIRVIPTPVISGEILEQGEAEIGHPWFVDRSKPVILSAARLERHKGFTTLIGAFAKLKRQMSARLVIIGDGTQRRRLGEQIRSLGLEEDVALLGFKKNPFPYMNQADAFVLASEFEGLPNVLVQAMAFGTPIVSTDCHSGPAEILCNGRYGTLVPVGDEDAIAQALEQAVLSPKRQDAMEYARRTYGARGATEAYLAMAGLGV